MRSLLVLWWWRWLMSVHDRLHANATPVWEASMREYDAKVARGFETETTFDVSVPNATVTHGSDNG